MPILSPYRQVSVRKHDFGHPDAARENAFSFSDQLFHIEPPSHSNIAQYQ